jgi:hypothetical protein
VVSSVVVVVVVETGWSDAQPVRDTNPIAATQLKRSFFMMIASLDCG